MEPLFLLVIMVIFFSPIIITNILARKYKENTLIKYIPSIISFLTGLLLFSEGQSKTGLFAGLHELFYSLAFFIFFIISFLTALILEIYNRFVKSKHK